MQHMALQTIYIPAENRIFLINQTAQFPPRDCLGTWGWILAVQDAAAGLQNARYSADIRHYLQLSG